MIVRKIGLVILTLTIYACLSFAAGKINNSFLSLFNNDLTVNTTETTSATGENTIQVALLLDTSGSMSGLIEQAKSQLWNILNELARTEKDGEVTTLEIALYEYGNPSKTRKANQVHQLVPFTTDMDLVSEKLFALKTSGGEEYCGTVIKVSLEELEWKSDDGLRMIYIAGNEEFTQGMVSYESACQKANEKDIVVNTIYCGDYQTGIREFWQAGAKAGKGEYLNINHNQETVYIKTPYDDQINKLNQELNKTYIPIGEKGQSKKDNQQRQDSNANGYGNSNAADRAVYKSSKKYKATDWDLVDAYEKDKSILKKKEVLPDTLQDLSIAELEIQIQAVITQRSNVQQQIQDLDKKRRQYKIENSKNENENSLQHSINTNIRNQALKKGYKIKD